MGDITLYLHHDAHFDLVVDESGDQAALDALSSDTKREKAQQEDQVLTGGTIHDSLGTYGVESGGVTQVRHKIGVKAPGNVTVVRVPEDYNATPIALTHLVETLTDRNADPDAITGVSGDNDRLVQRLAALLGVDVVEMPVLEEATQ